MKILSRNDLELIGERVYKGYTKIPEIQSEAIYRMDPIVLAEKLLGLTVDYAHLSTNGDTLGVTSFSNLGIQIFNDNTGDEFYYLDGKTILIEKDLTLPEAVVGRKNFTTAHEACHHILKMLFPNDYGTNQPHFHKLTPPRIMDWGEWQTDVLASCVLMPKDLIEKARFIFQFEDYLPILHNAYDNSNYRKFKMISEFLGVSKQALAIRLQTLGFIGKAYIGENRLDFLTVVKDD